MGIPIPMHISSYVSSASEATALWRYRSFFFIIIIISLLTSDGRRESSFFLLIAYLTSSTYTLPVMSQVQAILFGYYQPF